MSVFGPENTPKAPVSYEDRTHEELVRELELRDATIAERDVTIAAQEEQLLKTQSENGVILQRNRILDHAANYDPLTDVLNRRGLETAFPAMLAELDQPRRKHSPSKVYMGVIDLDNFTGVNDAHGHPGGDEALVATAGLLRAGLRISDLIARTGGDEFIIVYGVDELDEAVRVAERLRHSAELLTRDSEVPATTLTMGLAEITHRYVQLDNAYGYIDAGLFRAKKDGKNKVLTLPPISS